MSPSALSAPVFTEGELVPISALQHMIFCDRQAALIHIERIWLDNLFTVEGQDLHRVVDSMQGESRRDLHVRRGVAIRSDRLGLTGKADVIEFHSVPEGEAGIRLEGEEGLWKVVPVEYKRGKPKAHRADEVQLCAQAMCLEELFETRVARGFLFYGRTRRRKAVPFKADLRELTESTARDLHALLRSGKTPVRAWEKKCRRCSLLPACLPPRRNRPESVQSYLKVAFGDPTSLSE